MNELFVYADWTLNIKERACYKSGELAFSLVEDNLPSVKSSFVDRNLVECERYEVDKSKAVYSGDIPLGIIEMCIQICRSIK